MRSHSRMQINNADWQSTCWLPIQVRMTLFTWLIHSLTARQSQRTRLTRHGWLTAAGNGLGWQARRNAKITRIPEQNGFQWNCGIISTQPRLPPARSCQIPEANQAKGFEGWNLSWQKTVTRTRNCIQFYNDELICRLMPDTFLLF